MSKYRRLTDYLAAQTQRELVLEFEEIAHIINGYLPKSAERPRSIGRRHAGNRASRQGGYKTYLLQGQDKVRFVRAN